MSVGIDTMDQSSEGAGGKEGGGGSGMRSKTISGVRFLLISMDISCRRTGRRSRKVASNRCTSMGSSPSTDTRINKREASGKGVTETTDTRSRRG